MGFDLLGFIGLRDGYHKYMQDYFGENIEFEDNQSCIPEIIFSGAKCQNRSKSLSGCRMKNYKTEGGTCVVGISEVYMHCIINIVPEISEWNSWSTEKG